MVKETSEWADLPRWKWYLWHFIPSTWFPPPNPATTFPHPHQSIETAILLLLFLLINIFLADFICWNKCFMFRWGNSVVENHELHLRQQQFDCHCCSRSGDVSLSLYLLTAEDQWSQTKCVHSWRFTGWIITNFSWWTRNSVKATINVSEDVCYNNWGLLKYLPNRCVKFNFRVKGCGWIDIQLHS